MSVEEPAENPADEAHAALLDWLRASKCFALYMIDRDGKRRRLQLRNGAQRWQIAARVIMRAIDDIDHLEAEDKRGGVIDLWRVPEPVDKDTEQAEREKAEAAEDERKSPRELRAVAVLGRMLQDSADHAVDRHMKANRELLSFIMDGQKATQLRLETLERSLTGMLKTVFEAHKVRAQVEGFIAGGGLRGPEQNQDPNEALIVQLLAQKLGVQLPQQLPGASALAGAPAPTGNGHDTTGGEEF